jgi:hypothetical protein
MSRKALVATLGGWPALDVLAYLGGVVARGLTIVTASAMPNLSRLVAKTDR